MLAGHGSYAEYTMTAENNVFAVESQSSWEELATILEAY